MTGALPPPSLLACPLIMIFDGGGWLTQGACRLSFQTIVDTHHQKLHAITTSHTYHYHAAPTGRQIDDMMVLVDRPLLSCLVSNEHHPHISLYFISETSTRQPQHRAPKVAMTHTPPRPPQPFDLSRSKYNWRSYLEGVRRQVISFGSACF